MCRPSLEKATRQISTDMEIDQSEPIVVFAGNEAKIGLMLRKATTFCWMLALFQKALFSAVTVPISGCFVIVLSVGSHHHREDRGNFINAKHTL